VWVFPNSIYEVEGELVRFLVYDLAKGGFFFCTSSLEILSLFAGYDGTPYAVTADGIYELFSGSSAEAIQVIWKGGIAQAESGEILLRKLDITRLGEVTVEAYIDRDDDPSYTMEFADVSVLTNRKDMMMVSGPEVQLVIMEAEPSTKDLQVSKFVVDAIQTKGI
jgi:hypothetical protein